MSVYIVRLCGDGDTPHTFVGIYVAASPEALGREVEGVCATSLCEYAIVPHGCMYGGPAEGPDASPYEEDDEAPAVSERLSDDWRELFFGPERPRWQALNEPSWRSPAEGREALVTARLALTLA